MRQRHFEFRFNDVNKNYFCLSKKNYLAFNLISLWPKWPLQNVLIYGPKSCGKTLICSMWKKKSKAKTMDENFLIKKNMSKVQKIKEGSSWIVDDLDSLLNSNKENEEMMLFIFNTLKAKKCFSIFTSQKNPNEMNISLADLRSRLSSSLITEVKSPDDDLIKKIIKTKLKQKQIKISNEKIDFLIKRIDRDYNVALKISRLIDDHSLSLKSNISRFFLKKVLSLT